MLVYLVNFIVNSIITLYPNEMHCNSPWLGLDKAKLFNLLGKHLLKMQYFASSVCHCLTMCIRNLNECQCPHPSCMCFSHYQTQWIMVFNVPIWHEVQLPLFHHQLWHIMYSLPMFYATLPKSTWNLSSNKFVAIHRSILI